MSSMYLVSAQSQAIQATPPTINLSISDSVDLLLELDFNMIVMSASLWYRCDVLSGHYLV